MTYEVPVAHERLLDYRRLYKQAKTTGWRRAIQTEFSRDTGLIPAHAHAVLAGQVHVTASRTGITVDLSRCA